jgi:hypothetical protein
MIVFGQRRRVWFALVFSLALLNGCGSSTTAPRVAVGTPEAPTPTRVPPTSAPATPQPTLEPVTSRFLYVEGVIASTLAGDGHWGYRDGPGSQARFVGPEGVAIDEEGSI